MLFNQKFSNIKLKKVSLSLFSSKNKDNKNKKISRDLKKNLKI